MSIASEISRISGNVQNTIDTIEATGVTVPEGANSDNLPSLAQALANTKQDKLTGAEGQVVGFDSQGNAVAQDAPEGGVTSFNSRTGAITPQSGDYTAEMVGARPSTWTPSAADVGAVPTTRTVNGKALSDNISLTAGDVGAVPTSRTVNNKPLSSDVTLTAADVGAGAPATSTTITLTSTGWTGDSAPFSQQVSCSIVAADTAVVSVDAQTSGDLDANAEILNAWALVSQKDPTQGAGTMTFYATEKPTVNIPVKVGVS